MTIVDLNFTAVAPMLTLAVAALLVLLVDLILPRGHSRPWGYLVSLVGVLLSLWYVSTLWPQAATSVLERGSAGIFGGAVAFDRFGLLFGGVTLGAALLAVLLSFLRKEEDVAGYLALVLWSTMGMLVLASAGNFLTLFLGLELFSLSLYVLVAFGRGEPRGREAAFKYLVLGSVASAAMLYGFAFLYGQTGSMSLASLASGLGGEVGILGIVGAGLVVLCFLFKLALVPFHMWAPDVYHGASAPITAFMSVGTRAAAFAGLVRFLAALAPEQFESVTTLIWVMACASMVLGSLAACVQTNVKRLLAYSGIAHSGYLMLSLIGLSNAGISAGAFYLIAYLFMNTGAFAVILYLSRGHNEGDTLEELAGLGHRRPWLAGAMTLFMLSLSGFPATAGFSGKLALASTALAADTGAVAFWLVGALALTSAISAYAYLRVVVAMFAPKAKAAAAEVAEAEVAAAAEPDGEEDADGSGAPIRFSWALGAVILVMVVGNFYLGLMPRAALAITSNLLSF